MAPRLRAGERLLLPVYHRVVQMPYHGRGDIPIKPRNDHVRLWFEKFIRHNQEHWFAFTRDSDDAMSLKSVFLPGQWPAIHDEYQRGVGDGIVRALTSIMKQ